MLRPCLDRCPCIVRRLVSLETLVRLARVFRFRGLVLGETACLALSAFPERTAAEPWGAGAGGGRL